MNKSDSPEKSLPSAFNVSNRLAASKGKSLPKSNAAKTRKAIQEKVFSKGHFHSLVVVSVTCLNINQKLVLVSRTLMFAYVCLVDQPIRTRVNFSQWPVGQA